MTPERAFPRTRGFEGYALVALLAVVWITTSQAAVREPFAPYAGGKYPSESPAFSRVVLEDAFPNASIPHPMDLVGLPDGEGWLVASKPGFIYWLDADRASSEVRIALDCSAHTASQNEGGLYSVVLHPEFGSPDSPNRRTIFVWYQYSLTDPSFNGSGIFTGENAMNRLSRFELKPDAAEVAPGSETVLIEQRDRGVWHQGGGMFIHPFDGFLYLAVGDEGAYIGENTQILDNNLYSGVLRIDIDSNPTRSHAIRRQPRNGVTAGYAIPDDNPFLDPDGGVLEEFFAVGLRSPHTLVCDSLTGDIWCGDVGSTLFDEINRIKRGKNYGWAAQEGPGAGPLSIPENPPGDGFQEPWFAYRRTDGPTGESGDRAVICGPVYRGLDLRSQLNGKLIFGDNASGRIWSLTLDEDPAKRQAELLTQIQGSTFTGLSRFAVDAAGEVYCLQLGSPGAIWKLRLADQEPPNLPPTLSAAGVFLDLATLTPAPGFVSYDVNQPFWSDGAVKRRWVAIPNDGAPYDADEWAGIRRTDAWEFPPGTTFVKHFDLPVTDESGESTRKLETRLLIVDDSGSVYGFTYRWREDQSEADLVLAAEQRSMPVAPNAAQDWYFPSPSDCRVCHNAAAGHVLGVSVRQLNLELPGGANQIEQWEEDQLGVFLEDRGDPTDWSRLARLDDPTASLTDRIKTYLDINCAFCHRPGGRGPTFDARLETPAVFQGLVDALTRSNRDKGRERVVAAGTPAESELIARIDTGATSPMPPVGRKQVDREGVDLIRAWITALQPAAEVAGFAAHYFNGEDFDVPVETALESAIDHEWGSSAPSANLPEDGFSVRWTGVFTAPATGDHSITATADDGVRILIDDAPILDAWVNGSAGPHTATLFLSAGETRKVVVEYREASGDADCSITCQLDNVGPNLFTSAHVRTPQNGIQTATRPVLGVNRQTDGRVRLEFFAEGRPVAVEESVDLKTWSHVAFPDQAERLLLDAEGKSFFRIAPVQP